MVDVGWAVFWYESFKHSQNTGYTPEEEVNLSERVSHLSYVRKDSMTGEWVLAINAMSEKSREK